MNVVSCPHCTGSIEVEQINCGIFRHGVLKSNNSQINPHSSKEICEDLINNNLIYGCGKPFKIEMINEKIEISTCEYI